jgi:hypothetical protein
MEVVMALNYRLCNSSPYVTTPRTLTSMARDSSTTSFSKKEHRQQKWISTARIGCSDPMPESNSFSTIRT